MTSVASQSRAGRCRACRPRFWMGRGGTVRCVYLYVLVDAMLTSHNRLSGQFEQLCPSLRHSLYKHLFSLFHRYKRAINVLPWTGLYEMGRGMKWRSQWGERGPGIELVHVLQWLGGMDRWGMHLVGVGSKVGGARSEGLWVNLPVWAGGEVGYHLPTSLDLPLVNCAWKEGII